MKGKLFKTRDGYALSPTNDFDDLTAITNSELAEEQGLNKLSLKNCEVIENGYDLDELAENYAIFEAVKYGRDNIDEASKDFIEGAETMLELMEGKKFSEEDMLNFAWWLRDNLGQYSDDRLAHFDGNYLKAYLKSLQPKEWDVEIEMEEDYLKWKHSDVDKLSDCLSPKLDKDGCLILKRI